MFSCSSCYNFNSLAIYFQLIHTRSTIKISLHRWVIVLLCKAFNDVIEKYPDGSKVPDALLRLGMLEMEQKNVEKAREYFTRVTTEYPKSTVATIAVKKLLKLDEIKN